MELEQQETNLIEESSIINKIQLNLNANQGTLLLTHEKISLTEEIKILIRKLWN